MSVVEDSVESWLATLPSLNKLGGYVVSLCEITGENDDFIK